MTDQPTQTITIVVDDNAVLVNGKLHTVDCSALATQGVHAVQWTGGATLSGWVEYAVVNGTKQPNQTFTDFTAYQSLLDAWTAADNYVPPAPPPPTQAQLITYASVKQQKVASGGITVNVGTQQAPSNVPASTDPVSLVWLQGAYTMATANSSATFDWVHNGTDYALTAAQVIAIFNAVTPFLQSTLTALKSVNAAISAATITTYAQIDSQSWPVNS